MAYYGNQNDNQWEGGGDTSARGGSAHELYASARDDSAYGGRASSSRDGFGTASAHRNEEDHFGGYGSRPDPNVGGGMGYKSPPPEDDPYNDRKRSPNQPTSSNQAAGAAPLPLPVEGIAPPPDFDPVEPPMPDTRSSRRFPVHTKRQPDMMLGKVVDTDKASVRGDSHLVKCTECRCRMKVKKFAVLVRCPDCSHVSLASSSGKATKLY